MRLTIRNSEGYTTGGMKPEFAEELGEVWYSKVALRDYLFSYCVYWFDELRNREPLRLIGGDYHVDAWEWLSYGYYPKTLIERLEEDDGWVVEDLDTTTRTPVKEFYLLDGVPAHPMITYIHWFKQDKVETQLGPLPSPSDNEAYVIQDFEGTPLSSYLPHKEAVAAVLEKKLENPAFILEALEYISISSSDATHDGYYVTVYELLRQYFNKKWVVTGLTSGQMFDVLEFYEKAAGNNYRHGYKVFLPKELANARWAEINKRKEAK